MKQAITYRNIWRVSFPIILSSTAQNIVNAVDTAFLGRLSDVAVGAAGNAIIFYYIFVVAVMGFSIGAEILVGRKNGEGDFPAIGRVIDHCIYTFIPLSIVLFVILNFGGPLIIDLVTKSPAITTASLEFLNIRVFGIFFAMANLIFRIYYIGITNTRILTVSTFFMAVVNILLDYLLIFGNWGFPAMGISGAALASVIAEASTTVFFIIYTRSKVDLQKYGLFRFLKLERGYLKKVFKISTPTMIQSFLAVTAWMAFFLIIEKLGERELAISHIIRSIYMILVIPLFGFSAATSTLVSNVIGQGDIDQVLKLVRKSVVLSLTATATLFLPILIFPEWFLGIYTKDDSLIRASLPVLYIIDMATFLFAVAYILFSAVSGTGKTMVSLMIESFTLTIYLSVAYFVGIHYQLDLAIVWCSEFVYFGIMGPLSFLYLRYGNWRQLKL